MYTGFYGLSTDPFCLSPDPKFRFMHPSYRKAKVYMLYALQRAEGFVSITGAPGTGKSTLVKELVSELSNSKINLVTLTSTQVGADDVLRLIAYAFGITNEGLNKASVLRRLELLLRDQYHRGRKNLLIVDEAQDLPQKSLEELRLLTNMEQDNYPLLQIFLVGQQQLLRLLNQDSMEQLRQRIVASCALQPLSLTDIEPYVLHRLQVAGWKHDPIIEPSAYTFLYHFSGGVPRNINQICSRLLLHGFVEDKHLLSANDASLVIDELRQEQPGFSPFHQSSNDISSPIDHFTSVANGQ